MPATDTKHVEIRKNRRGEDRAYIAGTRVRVRDIYAHSEIHGESPEEIVAALGVAISVNAGAALVYSARVMDAYAAKLPSEGQR